MVGLQSRFGHRRRFDVLQRIGELILVPGQPSGYPAPGPVGDLIEACLVDQRRPGLRILGSELGQDLEPEIVSSAPSEFEVLDTVDQGRNASAVGKAGQSERGVESPLRQRLFQIGHDCAIAIRLQQRE